MTSATKSNNKKQVAIFGAGIAGLTAAHELVERGFDVEVYDCEPASPRDRLLGQPCAIGGMARTQWARVERERGDRMVGSSPLRLLLDEPELPGSPLPRLRVLFPVGRTDLDPGSPEETNARAVLTRVCQLLSEPPVSIKRIEVRGHTSDRNRRSLAGPTDIDYQRAAWIGEILRSANVAQEIEITGHGLGYPHDWSIEESERDYVSFHVLEYWLPGEHGFRFFPSFYRNVFDTMRRTPIADENEAAFQETPHTVLDNVVPTAYMALSTLRTAEPFPFRRRPSPSLQVLFDQLTGMLAAMGHSLDDMNRFHVKLFKYMTSCKQRRVEYERISWWDFLEADQFSEAFQRYVESGAETLVAMVARNCDARTYGSISVQMIQNQIASLERTDGTLNAPTSPAWFDHWRRYLELQGVRFRRGTLLGFEVLDVHTVWPRVRVHPMPWDLPESEDASQRFADPKPVDTALLRDYYVLALPADALQQLIRESPGLAGDDFERIRRFPLGDPTHAKTGGALEHMAGIQFFLPTDTRFIEGHTIFPDTPWRLSAIFQPQFWTRKRGWWSGYRGLLSVDISNWRDRGNDLKAAWECTRDEIAQKTLEQIRKGVGDAQAATRSTGRAGVIVPTPLFYHIDEAIEFKDRGGVSRNKTPFLLSRPNEYTLRPGQPGSYTLHPGRIVLAGVLMQTHTRLSSMEAANESGRHAANTILREENFGSEDTGELCPIFDLEEHEPEDLRFWKEIDERLCERGLPHLVDILDLREVPAPLLEADPGAGLEGLGPVAAWLELPKVPNGGK